MTAGHRALLALAAALASLAAAAATAQEAGAGAAHHDDATVHHRFDDAARWARVFDDPGRDAWQRPADVVAALGLHPGATVADLGAGTGYFLPWLADAVGEHGTVYAVEVEPTLVDHITARARDEHLATVRPVLAAADDPHLPAAALDAVLVVDTYHHIDDRVRYFRRLASRLRPDGRLVIVDFDPAAPDGPGPGRHHRLAASTVIRELEAAGWQLVRRDDALLEYQYLLHFNPVTD